MGAAQVLPPQPLECLGLLSPNVFPALLTYLILLSTKQNQNFNPL